MTVPPPLFPWRLILASASPRRRELLKGLDLQVETTSVDIDETPPPGMPPELVAAHLAVEKSRAWPGALDLDQVLVTADTTVLIDGELLNKPVDAEDAVRMLKRLSGATHTVITSVCVRTTQEETAFSDQARVTFAQLTEEEIAYYVARYQPLDKAGAYGVQEWIGYVCVERLEGSFYTVMGLPLHPLYQALKRLAPPATP